MAGILAYDWGLGLETHTCPLLQFSRKLVPFIRTSAAVYTYSVYIVRIPYSVRNLMGETIDQGCNCVARFWSGLCRGHPGRAIDTSDLQPLNTSVVINTSRVRVDDCHVMETGRNVKSAP